jgi:hypothetical protein
MWNFLQPLARFLNRPVAAGLTIGTLLAPVLLIAGIWLMLISGGQLWLILLGGFLLAFALGYGWIVLSRRR